MGGVFTDDQMVFRGNEGGGRGSVGINRICRGGLKKTDCQFTANEG